MGRLIYCARLGECLPDTTVDAIRTDDEPARPFFTFCRGHLTAPLVESGYG